jgi:hypothetical protein
LESESAGLKRKKEKKNKKKQPEEEGCEINRIEK